VDYIVTSTIAFLALLIVLLIFAFRGSFRRRNPWQSKVILRKELDIPPEYFELKTDYWQPIKNKGLTAFFTGLLILIPLWIPGIFFVDPVTHLPHPDAFYLGVLGATVVAILDMFNLKAIDWFKDAEAAPYDFAKITWDVRDEFECEFHTVIGKISKLSTAAADEIKEIIDFDDLKTQASALGISGTVDPGQLNVFHRPQPGCKIPDSFILSPAKEPSELYKAHPGAVIWKGYTRHHSATRYKEVVLDEYRYNDPLTQKHMIAPIVMAAGNPFEVTEARRNALLPPKVDKIQIANAKILADGRLVGSEAVRELATLKEEKRVKELLEPSFEEYATNTAGTALDVFSRARKPGQVATTPSKWTPSRIGGILLIVGSAAALLALFFRYVVF